MKKRVIAFLLSFCMVLSLAPAAFAEDDTEAEVEEVASDVETIDVAVPADETASGADDIILPEAEQEAELASVDVPTDPEDYAEWKASMLSEDEDGAFLMAYADIRNEYIQVCANNNGTFTIGTLLGNPDDGGKDDNKKLLYGHPNNIGTSETLIRINGTDYWFDNYVNSVQTDGDSIIAVATINNVEVKEILTLQENYNTGRADVVSIRYEATNNSTASKEVGVRIMLDTMLGSNDGSPFRVNGENIVREIEYSGNNIPKSWQSFDSFDNPSVVATGTFYMSESEMPDKVQFAYWARIRRASWDYTVSNSSYVTSDSAVAVYFNPRTLPRGGSTSVVTYYGISDYVASQTDKMSAVLTNPIMLYPAAEGGYESNPFEVKAYLKNTWVAVLNSTRSNPITATLTLNDDMLEFVDENGLPITDEAGAAVQSMPVTLKIGPIAVNEENTVTWNLRAKLQGGTGEEIPEASYTITVTQGEEVLWPEHDSDAGTLTTKLARLTDDQMYRTVTFDPNGGSFSDGSSNPKAVRAMYGTALAAETVTRAGYTFAGWFANAKCAGVPWYNATNHQLGNPITNAITLYAKWIEGEGQEVPADNGYDYVLTFRAEDVDNPVPYDASKNVPSDFRMIVLVKGSEAEGEVVASLEPTDVPDVPSKTRVEDGRPFVGKWDITEFDEIQGNMTINALYSEPIITGVTGITLYMEAPVSNEEGSTDVDAEEVELVEIGDTPLNILLGGAQQLYAVVTPDDADPDVVWTSSDATIATVDETSGLVTVPTDSVGGTVTITATSVITESASASCTIYVPVIRGISFESANYDLIIGDTKQLTYTLDGDESVDTARTWESQNPDVATVDENGVVTAVAAGTTLVTVTVNGAFSASTRVTVKDGSITKIEVEGAEDLKREVLDTTSQTRYAIETLTSLDLSNIHVYGIREALEETDPQYKTEINPGEYTLTTVGYPTLRQLDDKDRAWAETYRAIEEAHHKQDYALINAEASRQGVPRVAGDVMFEYQVVVSYPGVADVPLTVKVVIGPATVVGIAVIRTPYLRVYQAGTDFDKAGLQVIAFYSDNTSKHIVDYQEGNEVMLPGVTFTGYDYTTAGIQQVTVSYEGKSTRFQLYFYDEAGQIPSQEELARPSTPRMDIYSLYGSENAKQVELSSVVDDENATLRIFYTTDGSVPAPPQEYPAGYSGDGSTKEYNIYLGESLEIRARSRINVTGTTTIKAIAVTYDEANKIKAQSEIAVGRVSVMKAGRPTANVTSNSTVPFGSYIELSTTTQGATIYYSTTGEIPSMDESNRYNGPIPMDKVGDVTIRAIAVKDGYIMSDASTFRYTVPNTPLAKSATIQIGKVTSRADQRVSTVASIFYTDPSMHATDNENERTYVNGFSFTVQYDTSIFRFLNASSVAGYYEDYVDDDGTVYQEYRVAQIYAVNSVDENAPQPNGKVTISVGSNSDYRFESGNVATLTFQSYENARDGAYDLTIDKTTASVSTNSYYQNNVGEFSLYLEKGMIKLRGGDISQPIIGEMLLTDAYGNDIVHITDENGEMDSSLPAEVNVNLTLNEDTVDTYIFPSNDTNVTVFVVIYGTRGQLLDVQPYPWDLGEDLSSLVFQERITIPLHQQVGSIKVIMGNANMAPMMAAAAVA